MKYINEDLKQAIERLHECEVIEYIGQTIIDESFNDQIVWQGVVHQFEIDHPETDTCYAWSSSIDDSKERQYYAVLKITPVDSPINAVRASIVSDHKS